MALVAIIAAPILIGYGMNIETETETRYVQDGNAVNVTGLLTNDTLYNYTNANINELNSSNLYTIPANGDIAMWMPDYVDYSKTKTSIPYKVGVLAPTDDLTILDFLKIDNYAAGQNSTFSVKVYDHGSGNDPDYIYSHTYGKVVGLYYDKNESKLWVTYKNSDNPPYFRTWEVDNPYYLEYTNYTGITCMWTYTAQAENDPNQTYADINEGWRFPNTYDSPPFRRYSTPSNANDMLITFNLDSADPSENLICLTENHTGSQNRPAHTIALEKDTSSGSTEWYAYVESFESETKVKVPYNPDISNNSYQIWFTRGGAELRYVGAWHDTIGESNYFWSNKFEWKPYYVIPDNEYILGFNCENRSATYYHSEMIFRIDAANVMANTYQSIHDVTYDPQGMTNKANPATQIKDIVRTGTSITFGGITYTITDGKITIDGHSVPIRDMTFSSTVNDLGTYDNAISGTVVSQTAAPSDLVFGGYWVMSVSTYAQDTESYNVTHWVPGKFAWQGIDANFITVGLMASVSAFIGLAMYGRRSGAKVLPLLLVCGGAAFMFLLMI